MTASMSVIQQHAVDMVHVGSMASVCVRMAMWDIAVNIPVTPTPPAVDKGNATPAAAACVTHVTTDLTVL